jgi:hypothetical protein
MTDPDTGLKDPIVNDVYLDLDTRTDNRRIKITGRIADDWRATMSRMFRVEPGVRYTYVTLTNDSNPATVGRKGKIRRKTLETRYRKVSRS